MAEILPMSKYGSLFKSFLKEHYPERYAFLIESAELHEICLAVDTEARDMMWTLTEQYRAQSKRPTGDFMATVQYETKIHDQAEEIVLNEIVYRVR